MKREILFRGKPIDSKKWIEGSLVENPYNKYPEIASVVYYPGDGVEEMPFDNFEFIEVISKTVGQFTGLTDKNGVKIFEGDIVVPYITRQKGVVTFKNGMFCFEVDKFHSKLAPLFQSLLTGKRAANEYEIIGNIHDNPELLK